MKRIFGVQFLSLVLALSGLSGTAGACTVDGERGFMPENTMKISMFATFNISPVTEQRFNAVVQKVSEFYTPIVKQKGGDLRISGDWKSDAVNAYARRSGSKWLINILGGLARHPLMTEDGLMLVICHELGHHMGGAPKNPRSLFNLSKWSSNEGEADYWGTMKCMRRILQAEDNIAVMADRDVDAYAKTSCEATYRDAQERAICGRIANAGQALANVLGSRSKAVLSFATPDPSVVNKTFNAHPDAQCRMDTYYQANLCTRNVLDEVSDSDPARGVCTLADHFTQGIRPLCWYKPLQSEI